MDLEQLEPAVEVGDQAGLPGQQVDGPDAATGDATVTGGEFIMDVGRRQQGDLRGAVVVADTGGDPALAGGQHLVYKSVHSKRLHA